MATPRKPNAKRGRPRIDFLHDSDAPAIAIAMALQMIGASERNAYLIVSVLALGRKTAECEVSPRRKHGVKGGLPAGVLTSHERVWRGTGSTSATFSGFADTLARHWMLLEGSLVGVPADAMAAVRSLGGGEDHANIIARMKTRARMHARQATHNARAAMFGARDD